MIEPAVRLQRVDGIPIAVIRRQVRQAELSRVVPECCGLVWNAVKAQQSRGGRHVAVYLDGSIRVEVGVELLDPFRDSGDVVTSATPAGMAAIVDHRGPYGTLGRANDAIRRWCTANGHGLAGPSWEIYGHWQAEWTRDPSLIETQVCYLVGGGLNVPAHGPAGTRGRHLGAHPQEPTRGVHG